MKVVNDRLEMSDYIQSRSKKKVENEQSRNEKKIENEIKEYIRSHGGLCYKIHGGDLYQETGIPDLLCCWGGLFFGIEVKDPKGKPSAIQLAQGIRIKKAGGHFIIAKSVQDIKDYIEKEGLLEL